MPVWEGMHPFSSAKKKKKIKLSAVGILSKYSTTDLNPSLGRKGRDGGSFQPQHRHPMALSWAAELL